MKKFEFFVEETRVKRVAVNADTQDDAIAMLRRMYWDNNEIDMSTAKRSDVNYAPINEDTSVGDFDYL